MITKKEYKKAKKIVKKYKKQLELQNVSHCDHHYIKRWATSWEKCNKCGKLRHPYN